MKISVYVTSYNQRDYLVEAIDSVLAQTLSPHQIIVVDDCSSDGSQDVIEDYARRHPGRFTTIFHAENQGIGRSRVDAIEAVSGDYVSHLDGDDKYLPRKLEMEAQALEADPSARVAFSNYYYTNARGDRTGVWADAVKPPQGDVFARVFARDFPKHGLFRNELVHYESWKQIGFYDPSLNLYEDYEMLIRMTKQLRVVYHDEPLSEYRQHDVGLSRVDASNHLAAFDYIARKNAHLLNDLEEAEQKRVRRQFAAITAAAARRAGHQALAAGTGPWGGRREAVAHYLRAAKDRPGQWLDVGLVARILLPRRVYECVRDTVSRDRRLASFRGRAKALALSDCGDPHELLHKLAALEGAYGVSRRAGDGQLAVLRHEIAVSSDPRYMLPMPLRQGVALLRQELEWRRRAQSAYGRVTLAGPADYPTDVAVEPLLLSRVCVFAVEYGLQRSRRGVGIRVRYKDTPTPCIEFRTSLRMDDRWFKLAADSPADAARDRLIETLNRLAAGGVVFESAQESDGHFVFRLFVQPDGADTAVWQAVERCLGSDAKVLSHCDLSEGANRVYADGKSIHKVQRLDRKTVKLLMLSEEYNILRRLGGIEGVPQSARYEDHGKFGVLSYATMPGEPLLDYLSRHGFGRSVWFRCLAELSSLLERIHARGVVHRDLRPDNVLVGEDGAVGLIDFDQAVAGAHGAGCVDFKGRRHGSIVPCQPMPALIDSLGLREEYDRVVAELAAAWQAAARSDASSPGQRIAYYHWAFGEAEFPGERGWARRWHLMNLALRPLLPGARVLELGCNLGLLATHCMLHGAQRVTGVDLHGDILESARSVAGAAGVDVAFLDGDLNRAGFVDRLLEQQYDVVIALSVLHWLEDRQHALRILEAAPAVLFEGHDPHSVEVALLRDLGFDDVRLVGYSERLRGMYLAARER